MLKQKELVDIAHKRANRCAAHQIKYAGTSCADCAKLYNAARELAEAAAVNKKGRGRPHTGTVRRYIRITPAVEAVLVQRAHEEKIDPQLVAGYLMQHALETMGVASVLDWYRAKAGK